jgi:hypothetical protein
MRTALLLSCLAMLLPLACSAKADDTREEIGGPVGSSVPGRCERLSRPVLFVGTIQDVKAKHRGAYQATFAVDEVLRGQLGPTVVVEIQGDKDRCAGGRVAVGEKFLIPTWDSVAGVQRELTASCSGLLHGALAASELAFVKGAASRKTGTIDGAIAVHDDPYHSGSAQPRANVVVRAVGTGYSTRTGPDGGYRLLLPPGSYELEIVPDDPGLVEERSPLNNDKRASVSTGSCATRDFMLSWNGRIRGRLTDHRGEPAGLVQVHAFDTRYPIPTLEAPEFVHGPHTVTAIDGTYEIPYVQPGAHLVVAPSFQVRPMPSTFYPGVPASAKTRPVQVAGGKLVTGIDFQLRAPQPLRKITGTVKTVPKDASAFVAILNTTDGRTSTGLIGSNGTFDVQESAGANLVIRACRSNGWIYDPSAYPANLCGPPVKVPPGSDRSLAVEGPQ